MKHGVDWLCFGKTSSTCTLASSGKLLFIFGLYVPEKGFTNLWINDSWATNYDSLVIFYTYSNRKITVTSSTLATIVGIGEIYLTFFLILKDVFIYQNCWQIVFQFKNPYRTLNVVWKFHPSYCLFQDIACGERLNLLRKGIYFTVLKHHDPQIVMSNVSVSYLSYSNKMSFGFTMSSLVIHLIEC